MDAWTIAKGILLAVAVLVLTPLVVAGVFIGVRALVNKAREKELRRRMVAGLPVALLMMLFVAAFAVLFVIARLFQGY